jgi:hypothetical protein
LRGITSAGDTVVARIPLSAWEGSDTAHVTLGGSDLDRIEIDPAQWLPDVLRENDVWVRPPVSVQ